MTASPARPTLDAALASARSVSSPTTPAHPRRVSAPARTSSPAGRRARAAHAAAVPQTVLLAVLLAVLSTVGWLGCHTQPAPLPAEALLRPMGYEAARPPSAEDLAAARLAVAALASDRAGMVLAFGQIEEAESYRRAAGQKPSRLPALGQDLMNSTLDDDRAYREASKRLLKKGDPDLALSKRLKRAVDDDPLRLADRRIRDSRMALFAGAFNTVVEPVGSSLYSGLTIAPYKVALATVQFLASLYERDPLNLQGRQALVLRKEFLRAHPNSPKAPEIREQVADAEEKLDRTQRKYLLRNARRALGRGEPRVAEALSDQVLMELPEDDKAERVHREAEARVAHQEALRRRSVDSATSPLDDDGDSNAARLTRALLADPSALESAGRALLAEDPKGALADEAQFALALAQIESGYEKPSWDRIEALARRDPRESNMARHAAALATSTWQNPYGAFEKLKRAQKGRLAAYLTLGPYASGSRYPSLPRPASFVVEAPSVAQTLITAPVRILLAPFQPKPDFGRPTSVAGYRYIDKFPEGENRREVIEWLYGYEERRGNWYAALRLADFQPGFDPGRRAELVEQAGQQRLETAGTAPRRDQRGSMLRSLVREFPDSDAGRVAGARARAEVLDRASQHIRMTRDFLLENPRVAGEDGLGLSSEILDGDKANGELHPKGVTFLGAQTLEFALVADSGDEDDAPVAIERDISAERLSRLVAMLDETTQFNAQIDGDDTLAADARRDHYFERARLGLADRKDARATASSGYVYQSLRERYGLVRGRESILPFDLVFQGSLGDMSLGAFPRWRPPKETPDAFLYR